MISCKYINICMVTRNTLSVIAVIFSLRLMYIQHNWNRKSLIYIMCTPGATAIYKQSNHSKIYYYLQCGMQISCTWIKWCNNQSGTAGRWVERASLLEYCTAYTKLTYHQTAYPLMIVIAEFYQQYATCD